MKTIPLKLLSLLFLAGLLLHPSLSFKGAGDGLLLWFNVVFPTLFPFLVATSLVTALSYGRFSAWGTPAATRFSPGFYAATPSAPETPQISSRTGVSQRARAPIFCPSAPTRASCSS